MLLLTIFPLPHKWALDFHNGHFEKQNARLFIYLGAFILLPSHPLLTSQCLLNVDHFLTCFKLHMLHCYQLLSPKKEPSSWCCQVCKKLKRKKTYVQKIRKEKEDPMTLSYFKLMGRAFTKIGSFVWLFPCRTFILVRPSPSIFTLQKTPYILEESSFFKFKNMWVKL
jgi:hypothetical protein